MESSDIEHSLAEVLAADHREIDTLFEQAVAGDSQALALFKSRLLAHMRVEEEIVFPALAGTPLTIPTRVMTQEHIRLRELLEIDDFEAITTCLSSHNLKEERVIYPACSGPSFASLLAQVRLGLAG